MGGWRSEMLEILAMVIVDFGNPIEEKASGLEGCHGAFEVVGCRL